MRPDTPPTPAASLPPDDRPAVIGPAPATERAEALALVLSDWAADQRTVQLDRLRIEPERFAALVEARVDGVRRAAAWAELRSGRSAVLWPPRTSGPISEAALVELVEVATCRAFAAGAAVAQALVPPVDRATPGRLTAAGYARLTDLSYQFADALPDPGPRPAALQWRPVDDADRGRLAAVIERTYVGSHDCAELDGLRTAADALDEYAAEGTVAERGWWLASVAEADAGCLLLRDHGALDLVEIVYLGLVPEVRGRGLSHELLAQAWRGARAWGRRRAMAVVDVANAPALRLYAATGFAEVDRRQVYWRRAAGA